MAALFIFTRPVSGAGCALCLCVRVPSKILLVRAGGDPVLLPPLSLVWAACFLSFFRAVLLPPLASVFSLWCALALTKENEELAF